MWQDMRHRQVWPPSRLVQIKPVLGETTQVDDSEIRTARRDVIAQPSHFLFDTCTLFGICIVQQIRLIFVVRRWLAKVIKPRPDKLANDKRVLILSGKFFIRWVAIG